MRFVSGQCLKPVQRRLINFACAKLLNELVVIDAVLVHRNNLPGIDNLFALLDVAMLAVLAEVSVSLGLRGLVQCHPGKNRERMLGVH